jgi:hypothetical protein
MQASQCIPWHLHKVEINYAEGIAEWQSQSAASQRRVDGGTHLDGGENDEREGSFGLSAVFIGEGKRERWGRPLELASDAGVEPDWRAIIARRFPCSWVTYRWASVQMARMEEVFTLPSGLFFSMVAPLYFEELNSFALCDTVHLIQDLDRMLVVR